MISMFSGCSSLATLDVSKFDTSKVTYMGSMFYGCSSLTTLDVSKFDTSNVTSMSSMFQNCSKLTTLDVSKFDTSKITSIYSANDIFKNCNHLQKVILGKSFKFMVSGSYNNYLPTPSDKYIPNATGKWRNTAGKTFKPEEIPSNVADTYVVDLNYSITYNLNGGTMNGQKTVYNADTETFTLPTPTKNGYTFKGWTGSNGTTPQTTVTIAKGSSGNKSYTANWTLTNYSITYNLNGGNALSGQRTSYNITSTAYTLPTPTRTGYTFTGWTGSNGSTAQKTVTIATGSTGNKSYTANWSANKYTVTYNANGGAGTMSVDTVTYGSAYKTQKNAYTRTGYTFNGWNTKADGTGTAWALTSAGVYESGKDWTWTYTTNITLYAQWTINMYYLDLNGSLDGTSASALQHAKADVYINDKLDSSGVKDFYRQLAYGTKFKMVITPETGYSVDKTTWEGTITGATWVTPKITTNSYTLTYNANGGSVTTASKSVKYGAEYGTLPTPTWTGHTFAGWWTAASGGSQVATTNKMPASNVTLYAHWTTNQYTYTIKYVSKSGKALGNTTVTGAYGSSQTVTAKAITGYTTPTAQKVTFDSTTAKTITFTYTPVTYNIAYTMNGGSISGQPTSYTIESNELTLPAPSKTGYTFTGWTGSNGTTAQKTVKISAGSTGNKSYTANFSANQYKLTIHSNNGTLTCKDSSITKNSDGSYTATVTYDSTAFYSLGVSASRAGYTMNGFYTATSGGTKLWNNGGNCLKDGTYWSSTNTWKHAGNVDIYPQWTPHTLTIRYHSQGATSLDDWEQSDKNVDITGKDPFKTCTHQYDATYDGTYGLPNTTRLHGKTGYTATNYWLVGSATSTTKISDYAGMPKVQDIAKAAGVLTNFENGNVTLDFYAEWKANTYKVSFDGNGGTSATASKTVDFNTAYGTLPVPIRTGYKFTGWYTAKTGGTKVTETSVLSNAGDLTLYAQWEAMEATLDYNNWEKIFDKNVTSVSKGTKTVAQAKATAGAVRIDDGTGAEVYAYKEGSKLYYVSEASTVYMPATSKEWFKDGTALASVDLDWNTSKVVDMSGFYANCTSLTSIKFPTINTSKVRQMEQMFLNCSKLTTVDLSKFDTSSVLDMLEMFYGCSSLTNIDVTNFNTSKVSDMSAMFEGCSKLTSIDVSKFDTSSLTNTRAMFAECKNLQKIDLSTWNTPNLTKTESMFEECNNITSITFGRNFVTNKVTTMALMFEGCSKLQTLDISGFDFGSVLSLQETFENCSALTSLKVTKFNTAKCTNFYAIFQDCSSITNLPTSTMDTSSGVQMNTMFAGCSKLASIDLSSFKTSNAQYMQEMFYGCASLTSVDVSKFDTSNVKDMSAMFQKCYKLSFLNLASFKTSKVENFSDMFASANSIKKLDLSTFDTSSAKDMTEMFYGMSSMTDLNISSFDTSKVTSMDNAFSNSEAIERLTLGTKFRFGKNADLFDPKKQGAYTGKWTLNDPYAYKEAKTAEQLVNTYDGTKPGTYLWEKQTGSLTVTLVLKGNMASRDKKFNYTVTMPGMANQTVTVSDNSELKQITFDSTGKATFALSYSVPKLTINYVIPDGNYNVIQQDYKADGYTTTKVNDSGKTTSGNVNAIFTNTNGSTIPTGLNIGGISGVLGVLVVVLASVYVIVKKVFKKI